MSWLNVSFEFKVHPCLSVDKTLRLLDVALEAKATAVAFTQVAVYWPSVTVPGQSLGKCAVGQPWITENLVEGSAAGHHHVAPHDCLSASVVSSLQGPMIYHIY